MKITKKEKKFIKIAIELYYDDLNRHFIEDSIYDKTIDGLVKKLNLQNVSNRYSDEDMEVAFRKGVNEGKRLASL